MAGKSLECKVCPFDFCNKNLVIPRGYLVVPSGYHRKKMTQQWAFRFQKGLGAFMHYKVVSKYKGKIRSGLYLFKKMPSLFVEDRFTG